MFLPGSCALVISAFFLPSKRAPPLMLIVLRERLIVNRSCIESHKSDNLNGPSQCAHTYLRGVIMTLATGVQLSANKNSPCNTLRLLHCNNNHRCFQNQTNTICWCTTELFSNEESILPPVALLGGQQWAKVKFRCCARTTPVEINFAACPLNNFYRSWLEWVRRMIRLIASPLTRSGAYFILLPPLSVSEREGKKLGLICLLLQRPGQREPFELWEYSCAELFALIKVLRQKSMKNMCVGFIRLLCVKAARCRIKCTHAACAHSQRSWFYLESHFSFHYVQIQKYAPRIQELSFPAFRCSGLYRGGETFKLRFSSYGVE